MWGFGRAFARPKPHIFPYITAITPESKIFAHPHGNIWISSMQPAAGGSIVAGRHAA